MRVPALPPRLELISTVDAVRRFQITSSATTTPVTRLTLGSICGGIVTVANTTVTGVCGSYRLRKIVVWPAAGSNVVIEASLGGSAEQALQKDSVKDTNLPQGITIDQPVVFKPKRGTYLDMWQTPSSNGSDQLMLISGASGAVMDVHIVYTQAGVGPQFTLPTSSTIALGFFVYGALDTANKIQMQSLTNFNH